MVQLPDAPYKSKIKKKIELQAFETSSNPSVLYEY